MTDARVAFMAMPEQGHFQRLLPLIGGIASRGAAVHVFTDRAFRDKVEAAGGRFVDLFERHTIESADSESIPVPSRFVSFAGLYADDVIGEVEPAAPSLMVCDTFAVVGRVVASALGIPFVNVCNGHDLDPARVMPAFRANPLNRTSASCRRAVELLRERHGVEGASPFSYLSGLSPFLNIYCEPPEFLTESQRRPFEPVAFFGSLPSLEEIEARRRVAERSPFPGGGLRVYVSFGTVVWRYWSAEALRALASISAALGRRDDACALISLGGAEVAAEQVRSLERPNVSVARQVDQWRVLGEADVFVTHQGMNSTHEAIFHGVPMVSYPFFADQPALAQKCRELGLATPLVNCVMGEVEERDVEAALAEISGREESMTAAFDAAREWELAVIADRETVLDRIVELVPD